MKYRLTAVLIIFLMPLGVFGATRSLSLGLSGSDVTALQNNLIDQGYLAKGYSTGYFGALTETALQKFQCDKRIICSGGKSDGYGVYGPKTRAALALEMSFPKNPATLSAKLTPTATGPFEFSGWIPYWRSATGTQDVLPHLSMLTSVMPFVYTVKSDGTLSDNGNLSEEPWKTFIATAKAAKVRVIPTVMWGNGGSIHRILSNTKSRIALEDEIANLVKEKDFDGIDIDFEAKQRDTINYFSTFLKGLYARMGNKWVYCTVEARMPLEDRYLPGQTIPPDATDYANDYVSLNKYCDRVEIMAYDQGTINARLNAVRTPPYAPNADPEWVETLVQLAAQTISRNKLIVGIPTYGYEYEVTRLADSSYQYERLWPFNFKYATDIAGKLGVIPIRNNANEIGFSYDPRLLTELAPTSNDATLLQQSTAPSTTIAQNAAPTSTAPASFNYLSWSDAQAIKDKVDLAKKLGLRGVAIFKFDGGEDQNIWNILK